MAVHKNKFTYDMSQSSISPANNSFKRDWKPIEITESKPDQEVPQSEVDKIPCIDWSWKSFFQALFIFLLLGLVASLNAPEFLSFNQILNNHSEAIK